MTRSLGFPTAFCEVLPDFCTPSPDLEVSQVAVVASAHCVLVGRLVYLLRFVNGFWDVVGHLVTGCCLPGYAIAGTRLAVGRVVTGARLLVTGHVRPTSQSSRLPVGRRGRGETDFLSRSIIAATFGRNPLKRHHTRKGHPCSRLSANAAAIPVGHWGCEHARGDLGR